MLSRGALCTLRLSYTFFRQSKIGTVDSHIAVKLVVLEIVFYFDISRELLT